VGVLVEVLTVSVDEPFAPVIVAGLKVAEAPAGNPEMLRATSPVKLASEVTLML
jgi:hypothetical protein